MLGSRWIWNKEYVLRPDTMTGEVMDDGGTGQRCESSNDREGLTRPRGFRVDPRSPAPPEA